MTISMTSSNRYTYAARRTFRCCIDDYLSITPEPLDSGAPVSFPVCKKSGP